MRLTWYAFLLLFYILVLTSSTTTAINCGRYRPVRPWHPEFVRVNFTIWRQGFTSEDVWEAAEFSASIQVTVPFNASFYHVMQLAALADNTFRFSLSDPNGNPHYMYSINGMTESETPPISPIYWYLFRLPGPPDPKKPPGVEFFEKTGRVRDAHVNDGDNFLFWLLHLCSIVDYC